MNRITLDDLIGQKLTSVAFIHDYIQMGFEDAWGLSIFNRIRLANQGLEIVEHAARI